jgi:predicted kinase
MPPEIGAIGRGWRGGDVWIRCRMVCVIFVGIQGSGKSGFFKQRFADTHMRINLDMLKTRTREGRFFQLCLETRQPCVVDNTNPRAADRAPYIAAAKQHGFQVIGYYFDVPVREAIARNLARPEGQRVPVPGLLGTAKRMERPTFAEGFDALHVVRPGTDGAFQIETEAKPSTGSEL